MEKTSTRIPYNIPLFPWSLLQSHQFPDHLNCPSFLTSSYFTSKYWQGKEHVFFLPFFNVSQTNNISLFLPSLASTRFTIVFLEYKTATTFVSSTLHSIAHHNSLTFGKPQKKENQRIEVCQMSTFIALMQWKKQTHWCSMDLNHDFLAISLA